MKRCAKCQRDKPHAALIALVALDEPTYALRPNENGYVLLPIGQWERGDEQREWIDTRWVHVDYVRSTPVDDVAQATGVTREYLLRLRGSL